MSTCIHCSRPVTATNAGWADMNATGDDKIWRYVCDENDTFQAEHNAESEA